MYNIKGKKGITLVALIITIIVLLILAVVTIAAVTDDGIINYAQNSAEAYETAKEDEKLILGNYTNYLSNKVSPTKIIKFTVEGEEYEAIKGMNWSEWIESTYNTEEINAGKYSHNGEYYVSFKGRNLYYNDLSTQVTVKMNIIENGTYILSGGAKD